MIIIFTIFPFLSPLYILINIIFFLLLIILMYSSFILSFIFLSLVLPSFFLPPSSFCQSLQGVGKGQGRGREGVFDITPRHHPSAPPVEVQLSASFCPPIVFSVCFFVVVRSLSFPPCVNFLTFTGKFSDVFIFDVFFSFFKAGSIVASPFRGGAQHNDVYTTFC